MTLVWWLVGCGGSSPLAAPSVDGHNRVRQPFDLADLSWDDDLADESQAWIEHLAADESCALIHDGTTGHGENLYWSSRAVGIDAAIDAWAEEVMYYDLDSNSCAAGEQCGHYTQIVWSSTERVGCAVLDCGDGSEIAMCTYDPPGNFIGERPY